MYISFSVKNTQKISRNSEIQAISFMLCQIFTNIFLKNGNRRSKKHQNRKRNNQNRPKINLIIDEYDGETLSHDKANEVCCR